MQIAQHKGRNTIIELERLLASIWVLVYHRIEDVLHGYLAVEFFFVLSGLFFLSTYKKKIIKAYLKV